MRPEPPSHVDKRHWRRHHKLKALGYPNYRSYLASRHWKQTRERYQASDLPQECICGDPEIQLHHMTYERIGNERLTDLTPLCHSCHTLVHVLEWRGEMGLSLEEFCDEGRALEGRELLRTLAEEQARQRKEHIEARQHEVAALSFAARLMRARDHARFHRRVDVSGHIHVLKRMVKTDRSEVALTRQLRRIEEIAYGWDGWHEAV